MTGESYCCVEEGRVREEGGGGGMLWKRKRNGEERHPEGELMEEIFEPRGYDTTMWEGLRSYCRKKPSMKEIEDYDLEIVSAVRNGDVQKMKVLREKGRSFDACNKFGESVLHMACRRGDTEMVRLLVENGAKISICDDYGRTPLHDACWTCEPNFEVIGMILDRDRTLLRMKDCRGYSPLKYIRRNHWSKWASFFDAKKERYWAPLTEKEPNICTPSPIPPEAEDVAVAIFRPEVAAVC